MTILLMQGLKVYFYFGEIANIFNSTGIYHVDFPLFEYEMELARQFFAKSGRLWGYDPHFLAGYPLSFLWNSNVVYQVAAVALSDIAPVIIIKFSVLLIILLEPLLIYLGLRQFSINRLPALLTTLVMVAVLKWGQATIFLSVGMLNGYFVYLLAFYAAGLLYKAWQLPLNKKRVLQLSLVFSISLLVHKTFALVMLPFAIFVLSRSIAEKQFRRLAWLSLAAVFTLAVNLFWLVPMAGLNHYLDFSFNPFWRSFSQVLSFYQVFTGYQYFASSIFLVHLVLATGLGLLLYRFKEHKVQATYLVTGLVTLGLYIILNQFSMFEWLHASRFLLCFIIFTALALALAIQKLRPGLKPVSLLVTMILLANFFLPGVESRAKKLVSRASKPFSYKQGFYYSEYKEVMNYIRKNLDNQGAIFIQPRFYNEHLFVLSGLATGHRFINTPYRYLFLKHNYINRYIQDTLLTVNDEAAMWPGPSSWSLKEEDFSNIVSFLNVEWFFLYQAASDTVLAKLAGFQKTGQVGQFTIWRNTGVQPVMNGGTANLRVDYNRIQLTNIQSEKNEMVLKMHWFETMRVQGAAIVEPVYIKPYRLPFIRLRDIKESRVEISM